MRPITLTISAFGPYAEKTVLNFDELGMQRLFVITGPTGAGKTTVFEAILYALYGKLSKKGMDPASLRCDFLKPEDDILTFVDFVFEIGGKQYHIHRQPKQWVAKKRGDGKREVSQEVVLECIGHADFLPLTKISEVDAKIVELIGLEEEQFKKIVMLPQGAFQEFLISGTKEKSELLRNIFNTGLYDLALQRLKSRVSKMSGDYERVRMQYQAQCAMLKADIAISYGEFPSTDEVNYLVQVTAAEEAKIADYSEQVQKADNAYKEAIDVLNKQKQHNEDVRKWQEALADKAVLEKRSADIQMMKQRVIEAEKAEGVALKEARFEDEQAQRQTQRQGLLETSVQCHRLAQECTKANERYLQALEEKKTADTAFQSVPELSNKLALLQQYLQKKEVLEEAQRSCDEMQRQQKTAEQEVNEISTALKRAEKAAQDQQKAQSEHAKKQVILAQLNQTLQEERLRFKKASQVLSREEKLQSVIKEADEMAAILTQKEAELQKARAQNRQHVAASLAVNLKEDEPCPVCGAVHHPNVAVDGGENVAEETLVEARDQAQKAYLRVQATVEQERLWLDNEMKELLEMNPSLINIEAISGFLTDLTEKGKQNRHLADQLNKKLDELAQQAMNYEKEADELESLKQKQLVLQQAHTDVVTRLGQAQGMLQQTRKEIQNLEADRALDKDEDVKALADEIEAIQQRHQRANDSFNLAQEAHAKLLLDKTAVESALSEKKARLADTERAAQALQAAFTEARDDIFENEDVYLAAKADIADKAILKQQIEQYNHAWTQAVTTCDMLEERVKAQKEIVDLQALESKCQALQVALEEANTLLSEQKALCQSNAKILADIRKLLSEFKDIEQQYAVLGQLRDVLDGKNRFNMRFETFAQAYYFESMLEHANARLARMTHGRYSFKRKDTVRDGRKQAGLDLDVMDQYTGRARDVATLSGGESFKASLSLALGLADVVTSESGGVELSTIFIDEGFGTLDDESLDDTVETLLQLQDSGRLVGVISHVAELKERIPAHLVVSSGKRGSQAHFEVRE